MLLNVCIKKVQKPKLLHFFIMVGSCKLSPILHIPNSIGNHFLQIRGAETQCLQSCHVHMKNKIWSSYSQCSEDKQNYQKNIKEIITVHTEVFIIPTICRWSLYVDENVSLLCCISLLRLSVIKVAAGSILIWK